MIAEEAPSKYIALTMMHLGTRFQETIDLYKSDFDFKNLTVSIDKAYDYQRSMLVTQTKTAGSVRFVDLPKYLEVIMIDYIAIFSIDHKIISIKNKKSLFFLMILVILSIIKPLITICLECVKKQISLKSYLILSDMLKRIYWYFLAVTLSILKSNLVTMIHQLH